MILVDGYWDIFAFLKTIINNELGIDDLLKIISTIFVESMIVIHFKHKIDNALRELANR